MGRKGKEHRNIKSIVIVIDSKIIEIDLKSNERIRNEDDLNLIPSMIDPNKNINNKKTRRTYKTKNSQKIQKTQNIHSNQQIITENETNEEINEINITNESNDTDNIYNYYDSNENSLELVDNIFLNETSNVNENDEFNIFDDFNEFNENLFENDETDDLFFNFDQPQYF